MVVASCRRHARRVLETCVQQYGRSLEISLEAICEIEQAVEADLTVVVAEHHPEVDVPHSLSGPYALVPAKVQRLGEVALAQALEEQGVATGMLECVMEKVILPRRPVIRSMEERLDVLLWDDEVSADRHHVVLDHTDQVRHRVFGQHLHQAVLDAERARLGQAIGAHTDPPPETLVTRTIRTRQVYQIIKLTQCPLICPESANGSGEFEHRKRCREIGRTAPELLLNIISTTQAATKKFKNFTF